MEKLTPRIILRADMVRPGSVPAAITSIFDRLGNYILPRMGIQIGFEFFETGWLTFFGSVSDFRTYFGRPMFSNTRKARPTDNKAVDEPISWDYKFEHLQPPTPEESLAKILKRFYSVPSSLGEGTIQVIPTPESRPRYRVLHPSLGRYISAAKEIVEQAYAIYSTLQKKPNSK